MSCKSLQNNLEASKSFQMFFNLTIEALKRFEVSLEASRAVWQLPKVSRTVYKVSNVLMDQITKLRNV